MTLLRLVTVLAGLSLTQTSTAQLSSEVPRLSRAQIKQMLPKLKCNYWGSNSQPNLLIAPYTESPNQYLCDPISQRYTDNEGKGIQAILRSKSQDMSPRVTSVLEYFDKGTVVDSDLYFADMYVPTRLFTQGFKTLDSQLLVDPLGKTLMENFSLEFSTRVQLSDSDPEGEYEFGLLSDDGARMFAFQNGEWQEIINNDGVHPTKMGCGYRTLNLKRGEPVDIRVLYYQGPRYHIANSLLFRPKPVETKKRNIFKGVNLCGFANNNFYFNIKKQTKSAGMMLLEAQGWKVLEKVNFKMPLNSANPCVQDELVLTNFRIESVTSELAVIKWSTSLPARSQIRVMNVFSGEERLMPLGDDLLTDHTADLTGLTRGGFYMVQAISVDELGQQVSSQFLNFIVP